MISNRRWLFAAIYPFAWLVIYQASIFISVFVFGEWDPKFGVWGTVQLAELVSIVFIGVPIVAYSLGLMLYRQVLRDAEERDVLLLAILTLAAHVALWVFHSLMEYYWPLKPGLEIVNWLVVVLCVAPFGFVILFRHLLPGMAKRSKA